MSSLISGGRRVAMKTEFIDSILEIGQWKHHNKESRKKVRNESHNDCLDRESDNQAIIGVNKDHNWGFRKVCTIQSSQIRMEHSVFRSE